MHFMADYVLSLFLEPIFDHLSTKGFVSLLKDALFATAITAIISFCFFFFFQEELTRLQQLLVLLKTIQH